MTLFDEQAATWDDDPGHVERAKIIAEKLKKALGKFPAKSVLEYGSGTGQLSFMLKDDFQEITLMDESVKMTKVSIQKCKDKNSENLHPVTYDLIINPLPDERYDLIYTLLTLHHIENTEIIFSKFNQLLNPGGTLVLIDLEKEDGSFHDYEFHGHLGFDREPLEEKLKIAGLTPVHYEVCYSIEKELGDGRKRDYPLFLLVAKKTNDNTK